jgi:hypothetical protein
VGRRPAPIGDAHAGEVHDRVKTAACSQVCLVDESLGRIPANNVAARRGRIRSYEPYDDVAAFFEGRH